MAFYIMILLYYYIIALTIMKVKAIMHYLELFVIFFNTNSKSSVFIIVFEKNNDIIRTERCDKI